MRAASCEWHACAAWDGHFRGQQSPALHIPACRSNQPGDQQQPSDSVLGLYNAITSCSGSSTPGASAGQHTVCVVFDSMTALLLLHSTTKVLQLLESLINHPGISCIIAALHEVSNCRKDCLVPQANVPTQFSTVA